MWRSWRARKCSQPPSSIFLHTCLNGDEFKVVKDAVALLEPFEEATTEISAEKFISLSKLISMIRALQDCTNSNYGNSSVLCDQLKIQLQSRFSRLETIFLLGAATVLDPRFKKVPFSDMGNAQTIENRLVNLMRSGYAHEAAEPLPQYQDPPVA